MMWVDVPKIFPLSLFFSRDSRASTKNSARYQEPVGKFSSGLSLEDDPLSRAVGMPQYKLSKYQYTLTSVGG